MLDTWLASGFVYSQPVSPWITAVPTHVLALATRIEAMGRDIGAINRHVLNRGIDLMGRALLQDVAAPMMLSPRMRRLAAGLGPFALRAISDRFELRQLKT